MGVRQSGEDEKNDALSECPVRFLKTTKATERRRDQKVATGLVTVGDREMYLVTIEEDEKATCVPYDRTANTFCITKDSDLFFGTILILRQILREFFASGDIFSICLASAKGSTSSLYLWSLSDIQHLTTFDDYRAGPDPGNDFWVKVRGRPEFKALNDGGHGLNGISNVTKIGNFVEGTLGLVAAAKLYRFAVTGNSPIKMRDRLAACLKAVLKQTEDLGLATTSLLRRRRVFDKSGIEAPEWKKGPPLTEMIMPLLVRTGTYSGIWLSPNSGYALQKWWLIERNKLETKRGDRP